MSEQKRAVWARIGIAALNLLAPGLGLLRLQRVRPALFFLPWPAAVFVVIIAIFASLPTLTFGTWAGVVALALAAVLIAYVGSIFLSWRASRVIAPGKPWWSRWYGLVAAYLLLTAISWPLTNLGRSYYRAFYVPAESMSPTLLKNDRFVTHMRPGPARRGDIIILRVGGFEYVKRVAGLPGDRVELIEGVVFLNGRRVPQRLLREEQFKNPVGPRRARRLLEQFPGEPRPHEIYDLGYTAGDDFAAQRIPAGHLFVLGDNRDQSADSRYSRDMMGVAMLPMSDVLGIVRFIYWRPGSGAVGMPLAHD